VVVTDLERGGAPDAVLTGDTLFIGDVGRPDLAENHTPQELARLLYDSLREKILKLPDDVLVYRLTAPDPCAAATSAPTGIPQSAANGAPTTRCSPWSAKLSWRS